MDLRLTTRDLRKLDLFVSELIILPVFSDERPAQGTTGLADYRLLGSISALIASGSFQGAALETHVLRPRPRLPFDRLLLLGCGAQTEFNPQIFAALVEQMLRYATENGIRRAVVDLPGRSQELITPELAIAILTQRAEAYPNTDTWTLIDTPDAAKVMARTRPGGSGAWGVGH